MALAAWVWLALVRGMYWRTNIRLPSAVDPTSARWPSVAIIVPARDEVDVLPLTLSTLVGQDYRGRMRVILVDDNSTDGTAALVADRWPDITVIGPGEPPAGWAGKLWALRAGVAAADAVPRDNARTDAVTTEAAGTGAATADAMTDAATTDAATTDAATTDVVTTDRASTAAATTGAVTDDAATTDAAPTDGAPTDAVTDAAHD